MAQQHSAHPFAGGFTDPWQRAVMAKRQQQEQAARQQAWARLHNPQFYRQHPTQPQPSPAANPQVSQPAPNEREQIVQQMRAQPLAESVGVVNAPVPQPPVADVLTPAPQRLEDAVEVGIPPSIESSVEATPEPEPESLEKAATGIDVGVDNLEDEVMRELLAEVGEHVPGLRPEYLSSETSGKGRKDFARARVRTRPAFHTVGQPQPQQPTPVDAPQTDQ